MSSRRERKKKRALEQAVASKPRESGHPGSLAPAALDVERKAPAVSLPAVDETSEWTPEMFARRAKRERLVKIAVAASFVAILAGGIRYASRSTRVAAASRGPAVVAVKPPPPPEVPPPPADPAPVAADAPAAETPPADAPAADPPPATEAEKGDARKAKHESQRALEIGHVADSIEAGERSVALDPNDREAWLILGAAYMQRGTMDDARRAFQSCLKAGTRGETWQCAAMLR